MVPAVLVAEDSRLFRKVLNEYITEAGYNPVLAEDGVIAWHLLEKDPERYSAVILDREMPKMEGLEVLKKIKRNFSLKLLPVIIQTSKDSKADIIEGLEAGAYYYLTKPYEKETFIAIVKTAVTDYEIYKSVETDLANTVDTIENMAEGIFTFRTLHEARKISNLVGRTARNSAKIALGLCELLINAIEHGNLGISYSEKSKLCLSGGWESEVSRRLNLPENKNRAASLIFRRERSKIVLTIKDEGDGFDWNQFMKFNPERAFDFHGRGIATCNEIYFDGLEYLGKGNEVVATINLDEK
jgi:DNA-binding response OmpR family regulator